MNARTSRKSQKNATSLTVSPEAIAPEVLSAPETEPISPEALAAPREPITEELGFAPVATAEDAPEAEASAPAVSALVPLAEQLTEAEIAAQTGETAETAEPKAKIKRAPRYCVQFIDSLTPDEPEIDSEHNSVKQAQEALKGLVAFSKKRIKNCCVLSETETEVKLGISGEGVQPADYATVRIVDSKSQEAVSASESKSVARLAHYDIRQSLNGAPAEIIATVKSYYNGKDEAGKRIPNGAEGTIDTLAEALCAKNDWTKLGYSHAGFRFFAKDEAGETKEVGWMRICDADGNLTETGQRRVDIIEKRGTTKHRAGKTTRQALNAAFADFVAAPLATGTQTHLLACIDAYRALAVEAHNQNAAEFAAELAASAPAAEAPSAELAIAA